MISALGSSAAMRLVLALVASALTAARAGVPVYVMLPLDLVTHENTLNNPQQLEERLGKLKAAGAKGIMTDVWWGIAEGAGPKQYNFSAWEHLAVLSSQAGLSMQAVMSFHKCGMFGDVCDIPVPAWARAVPDIWFKDREGNVNDEYMSLFADDVALVQGRTPLQIYRDFMQAFRDALQTRMGSLVTEVMVGLGPSGELRYPSYPSTHWQFCGVGEFQCYDKYALQSITAAAIAQGRPDWGYGGPGYAGTYNTVPPSSTGFFAQDGAFSYASDYGRFFLDWYSTALVDHGRAVLAIAREVFPQSVATSAKVAGIHWWFKDPSRAAEATAGYSNSNGDAYVKLAQMMKQTDTIMDFTALEMTDEEQPDGCGCGPSELVQEAIQAAASAGVGFGGENALPRYDETAYNNILKQCASSPRTPSSFTYLRLDETLVEEQNLATFAAFTRKMAQLGASPSG